MIGTERARRRVCLSHVEIRDIEVLPEAAHYLRDVLRLGVGEKVEAFDESGNVGQGELIVVSPERVVVRIQHTRKQDETFQLTIAAAVPKGNRADWMIEKLGELGVSRFVPLATARSVVLPEGTGKIQRWKRLAEAASRQSGRAGVMGIEPLIELTTFLAGHGTPNLAYLSTELGSRPIVQILPELGKTLTVLVGPEGGWTDEELEMLAQRKVAGVRLTNTVLRVETAAVSAAAILLCGQTR